MTTKKSSEKKKMIFTGKKTDSTYELFNFREKKEGFLPVKKKIYQ